MSSYTNPSGKYGPLSGRLEYSSGSSGQGQDMNWMRYRHRRQSSNSSMLSPKLSPITPYDHMTPRNHLTPYNHMTPRNQMTPYNHMTPRNQMVPMKQMSMKLSLLEESMNSSTGSIGENGQETPITTAESDKVEDPVVFPQLHVLVVDDTPISRKMQCRLLKRRCREFIEAEDGQQAVDIIRVCLDASDDKSSINLILMDSVMPVLNGPDAVKQIREMGYNGMVIGITGNVAQDDIDKFLASGADVILPKPLDVTRFDYAIKSLLYPDECKI
eukprot:CAMPEP_0182431550 /NCGR_PEP_ID=MMETSP1167-20130531/50091_1 /TAXON_ID=2988 /ORGANISM="Mallomonas Sp, Strain CCMP3275" /LENGTH=271 /DNA_ID=CAMNT_0024618025 /DNA_START=142 /DNA_END=957 /DNA_ORIENTATION=+